MDQALQDKQVLFLEHYARTGIVAAACRASGVTRQEYKRWCEDDEDFEELAQDAREDALDDAELELRQRGVEGSKEPVIWQGMPVYKRDPETGDIELDDNFEKVPLTITVKSDKLLQLYMQGNRQRYRDKTELALTDGAGGPPKMAATVQIIGADGKPVDASTMFTDQKASTDGESEDS